MITRPSPCPRRQVTRARRGNPNGDGVHNRRAPMRPKVKEPAGILNWILFGGHRRAARQLAWQFPLAERTISSRCRERKSSGGMHWGAGGPPQHGPPAGLWGLWREFPLGSATQHAGERLQEWFTEDGLGCSVWVLRERAFVRG